MHLTNTLSTLLFLFLSTLPEPSLSLGKVRGINCNSANPGFCIPTSFFAQGKIFDAARDVNTGTCLHWDYSYNGTFQIACYTFGGGETGFCLSTKHVAPNQTVTGQQIFDAMDRLQGHCKLCGEAPFYDNTNTEGSIRLDYAANPCGSESGVGECCVNSGIWADS